MAEIELHHEDEFEVEDETEGKFCWAIILLYYTIFYGSLFWKRTIFHHFLVYS